MENELAHKYFSCRKYPRSTRCTNLLLFRRKTQLNILPQISATQGMKKTFSGDPKPRLWLKKQQSGLSKKQKQQEADLVSS